MDVKQYIHSRGSIRSFQLITANMATVEEDVIMYLFIRKRQKPFVIPLVVLVWTIGCTAPTISGGTAPFCLYAVGFQKSYSNTDKLNTEYGQNYHRTRAEGSVIVRISTALHFFHILLCYSLIPKWIQFFSSEFYTQHAIMTTWKKVLIFNLKIKKLRNHMNSGRNNYLIPCWFFRFAHL